MTNNDLAKEYQQGNEEALEVIYNKNLNLIKKLAAKYPAEYFEDLIQESYFSLYKALEKWEEEKEVLFSTFFFRICKTDFTRYCYKQTATEPEYIGNLKKKAEALEVEYQEQRQRKPTDEEIKRALNVSADTLEAVKRNVVIVSMDAPLDEDGAIVGDFIPAGGSVEEEILQKEEAATIWQEVEARCKSPDILRQIYQEEKSLQDIAESHGLTYSQVKERKARDLARLQRSGKIKSIYEALYKPVTMGNFKRNHTSEEELYILRLEGLGVLK